MNQADRFARAVVHFLDRLHHVLQARLCNDVWRKDAISCKHFGETDCCTGFQRVCGFWTMASKRSQSAALSSSYGRSMDTAAKPGVLALAPTFSTDAWPFRGSGMVLA